MRTGDPASEAGFADLLQICASAVLRVAVLVCRHADLKACKVAVLQTIDL